MNKSVADRAAVECPVQHADRRRPDRRDDVYSSSPTPPIRPQRHLSPDPLPEGEAGVTFVVGAPRSGTTWLAKILDSHPDVVYRHEPDEWVPSPTNLDETNINALVSQWIADHSLRTSAKRPFFPKSWQTTPARLLRSAVAGALGGLPLAPDLVARLPLPDLGTVERARVVIKTVRWCDGIGVAARALPTSRTILIMRQPGAQVFSLMRGARERKFQLREGGDLPLDLVRAMACAASYGIDGTAFARLPEAARYAWGWVAFNETAEAALAGLPNAWIIRYEDLCADPEHVAREAMAFAGLTWHAQTADFVRRSARHVGPSAFYGVFQNAALVCQRWRTEMNEDDRRAVEAVAGIVSVARRWQVTEPEPACRSNTDTVPPSYRSTIGDSSAAA
jgi:hypothetical protein